MKLYHGSLTPVVEPRVLPPGDYRPLDFGTGFYTTTSFEQAAKWVKVKLGHARKSRPVSDGNVGFVTTYDFDESLLSGTTLKVLRFDGVSPEWLEFIAENRLRGNVEHGYDIVAGPVANDRVYTVLNLYENGFIDQESAIARMKAYRLADQVLFHTEKALTALRYSARTEVSQ